MEEEGGDVGGTEGKAPPHQTPAVAVEGSGLLQPILAAPQHPTPPFGQGGGVGVEGKTLVEQSHPGSCTSGPPKL